MVKSLRFTGLQYAKLRDHLFPGDGKEAAALIFCNSFTRENDIYFLAKEIKIIPFKACTTRTPTEVTWPTDKYLVPEIERLEKEGLSLIIIHSHPTGFPNFSNHDDVGDTKILGSLLNCVDSPAHHGSAIMLPDGTIKARIFTREGSFAFIQKVTVAGDQILYFTPQDEPSSILSEDQKKNEQVLGKGTFKVMRRLMIGVVGCSGNGSPTIELLMRHSAGMIVGVDFDIVKIGNLNRIIMSRLIDAKKRTPKVQRIKEWSIESGLETVFIPVQKHVEDDEAIYYLSMCDIIIGCVDNVEARHFLNQLCTAYLIPFFDLGVGIQTNPNNQCEVTHAIARCHYMQPDKSGLLDRGAFSPEALAAEEYKRTDPEYYKRQVNAGYLGKVGEDQPAVMALTMDAALLGVQDMLARLQNFRVDENFEFELQEKSWTHGYYIHRSQSVECKALKRFIAVGDKIRRKK